jgi:alkanesulfonate monooxygenase SsuD/methylene tetrahydromethanopterin reductase-like flavin-dependent oxidoreductase (luciferase family)
MLSYHGKYWNVPPEGTPWAIDATKLWGAGVDEYGIVRQVGVVPKPLQKPHPPIFQPFASSENTIRWCAREGVTAILPPMYLALQNRLYDVYREEAEAHGRTLRPGEGLGVLRDVIVADTDAEALELWSHGAAFCGAAWFAPFHFGDVLVEPGSAARPTPQQMVEDGMLLVGSVDTVRRSLERLQRDTPVNWLFAWQYNGLIPHGKILRSLELFATKVLPAVSS